MKIFELIDSVELRDDELDLLLYIKKNAYRSSINKNGFRKGHIYDSYIQHKFGTQIMEEIVRIAIAYKYGGNILQKIYPMYDTSKAFTKANNMTTIHVVLKSAEPIENLTVTEEYTNRYKTHDASERSEHITETVADEIINNTASATSNPAVECKEHGIECKDHDHTTPAHDTNSEIKKKTRSVKKSDDAIKAEQPAAQEPSKVKRPRANKKDSTESSDK